MFGCVVILLFSVVILSVVGCALLDIPCMVSQRICVLCLCSFHMFCWCFCMSDVENWITGVCSSYVVSLCDFAYYVFG